jgi:hypothetical protein
MSTSTSNILGSGRSNCLSSRLSLSSRRRSSLGCSYSSSNLSGSSTISRSGRGTSFTSSARMMSTVGFSHDYILIAEKKIISYFLNINTIIFTFIFRYKDYLLPNSIR